jgi:[glutamine synthetase] adenylyltransferase / [glutamine synthetase]-adenylyl-L-tyrosine phosphorylase
LTRRFPPRLDPDRALNNLERYQQLSAGGLRPVWLARERPFLLRLLIDLFGFSQFLSDVLIRYPHYTAWLGEEGVLDQDLSVDELRQSLERAMAPFTSSLKRQHAAVRWLRRELLRCGLRVMIERVSEPGFTEELSRVAVAVIRVALAEIGRPLRERFGPPMEETDEPGVAPVEAGFCVVAMGKLGGMELNFSSDVDLIFVYSDEGRTTGVPAGERGPLQGRIANHDYFRRLAEGLVQFLATATDEGYLFRVDTRLRPDGAEGPLARSVGAFEVYYESQARPWERMALIKSRAIAGAPTLCRHFDAMSRGLVFGRAMGPEIIDQVRDLKQRIDAGVDAGEAAGREIKRGRGGIREIEFLIQTFQLLHGAREPDLQVRSTLELIPAPSARGHLDSAEAEQMAEDYIFLRRLEHRLQMMDLRQTHTLPQDSGRTRSPGAALRPGGTESEPAGRACSSSWEAKSPPASIERFIEFFGQFDEGPSDPEADPVRRLAALIASGAPDKELFGLLAPFGLDSGGAIASLRRMGGRGRSLYLSSRAVELFPRVLPRAARAASPAPARCGRSTISTRCSTPSAPTRRSTKSSRPARACSIFYSGPSALPEAGRRRSSRIPEYFDYLLDAEFLADPRTPALLPGCDAVVATGRSAADEEPFAAVLARFRRFEALMTGIRGGGGAAISPA